VKYHFRLPGIIITTAGVVIAARGSPTGAGRLLWPDGVAERDHGLAAASLGRPVATRVSRVPLLLIGV